MNADECLMMGRLYAREHAPYFSMVILSLIPHPEPRVQTLGVTPGMVLYYNPKFLESLPEEQLGTVLWHESQHVLRDSFTRLPGINPELANICTDLAINSSSRHSPQIWQWPSIVEMPAKRGLPEDLTAEEYYALIPHMANPDAGVCGGQCGGIAGHTKNKELEQELDREFGRDSANVEMVKQQVAHDIKNHERKHGKVPGNWSEWASTILAPAVIPWEVYFQNTVRACSAKMTYGDSDYTMARPGRRTYAMPPGPFRPSLIGEEVEFAIILDTSGSMDIEKNIRPCLREARGAIMASGSEDAWFLQADTNLSTKSERVRANDLLNVEITGRGGTDFRPAIKAACDLYPRPNIIIYYTDGYGPAPDVAPQGIEVIWCLVGPQTTEPASWGHVVRVPL